MDYEDFRNKVKEEFCYYLEYLSDEEAEEYLKKEENKIVRDYELSLKEFQENRINEVQFKESSPATTGHCLSLMYE